MTAKFQPLVVKPVGFGNQDPKARFFSVRPDVPAHFHKPGRYYCGKCMKAVVV